MLLGVAGCQSTPAEQSGNSEATNKDVQVSSEVRSFDSIQSTYTQWETKLEEHSQYALYAPENYKELKGAWADAQEIYADIAKDHTLITDSYSIFSSQTYAQAFDEKVETVQSNYDAILVLKEKADQVLADSIAQMDYLKLLGADTMFKSNYERLYSEYSELFNYVLVDELEDAQEAQVEFLNNARVLEVKVAHKKYITPLKEKLELLEDEDFHEVVPLTFAKANSQIELAENKIKASPREKSIIEDAVTAAEFELNHVRSVAHEVKLLASIEDDKFEQAVLSAENQLLSISKAINDQDYRDVVLRIQSQKIVDSVKKLKSSDLTSELTQEIESLTAKLAKLETENQKQAQQLIDTSKQSELLTEQVSKSDAHIKSLEDLVSSLKIQANTASSESVEQPAVDAVADPVTEVTQPQADTETAVDVENS
nr:MULTISPECIES: ATPase [unclassified Vibrio]